MSALLLVAADIAYKFDAGMDFGGILLPSSARTFCIISDCVIERWSRSAIFT